MDASSGNPGSRVGDRFLRKLGETLADDAARARLRKTVSRWFLRLFGLGAFGYAAFLVLLMVSMRCASDGRVEIESARLRGRGPLSSSSDEVVQPKAHLGEGTGADVVRHVPATLDDWAASLLWTLLKVHRGPLLRC